MALIERSERFRDTSCTTLVVAASCAGMSDSDALSFIETNYEANWTSYAQDAKYGNVELGVPIWTSASAGRSVIQIGFLPVRFEPYDDDMLKAWHTCLAAMRHDLPFHTVKSAAIFLDSRTLYTGLLCTLLNSVYGPLADLREVDLEVYTDERQSLAKLTIMPI